MNVLPIVMQVGALLCLVFAAFHLFEGGPSKKPAWGWLGMALWLASLMVTVQLHTTN